MNKMSRAALVAACVSLMSVLGHVQANGLTPDQYVRALTQHLQQGGELDGGAAHNVQELAVSEQVGVDQEVFVRLGNELYRTGHADLGDLIMRSKVVAPDQYEGAELRVERPEALQP